MEALLRLVGCGIWDLDLPAILGSLLGELVAPAHEYYLHGRRLVVLREIGEGGFAFVYCVRDVSEDGPAQEFALKRILAQSPEQLDAALREVRACQWSVRGHWQPSFSFVADPGAFRKFRGVIFFFRPVTLSRSTPYPRLSPAPPLALPPPSPCPPLALPPPSPPLPPPHLPQRARTAHITEAGHFLRVFDAVKITDQNHKVGGCPAWKWSQPPLCCSNPGTPTSRSSTPATPGW